MSDPDATDLQGIGGRLELSAPAEPEIVDLVHAMLEQLWARYDDVGERDRTLFEMAVVEVLANIVEHAYRLDLEHTDRQRRFEICVGVTDDELVAAFADNGQPMEIDLSNAAMPDELAESGRGLALASAALDDLSYDRSDGRNHWRLLCRRRPG